jgi:hypothetical protein
MHVLSTRSVDVQRKVFVDIPNEQLCVTALELTHYSAAGSFSSLSLRTSSDVSAGASLDKRTAYSGRSFFYELVSANSISVVSNVFIDVPVLSTR